MPLNSIPATTTVDALEQKRAIARGRCHVDVGFIGGVVPGNAADLAPLTEAGVLAFKCFLVDSGVKEFAHVDDAQLRESMPILSSLGRVLRRCRAPVSIPVVAALDPSPTRLPRDLLQTRPGSESGLTLLIAWRSDVAHVHVVPVPVGASDSPPSSCGPFRFRRNVSTLPCFHRLSEPPTGRLFKSHRPVASDAPDTLWAAFGAATWT